MVTKGCGRDGTVHPSGANRNPWSEDVPCLPGHPQTSDTSKGLPEMFMAGEEAQAAALKREDASAVVCVGGSRKLL